MYWILDTFDSLIDGEALTTSNAFQSDCVLSGEVSSAAVDNVSADVESSAAMRALQSEDIDVTDDGHDVVLRDSQLMHAASRVSDAPNGSGTVRVCASTHFNSLGSFDQVILIS